MDAAIIAAVRPLAQRFGADQTVMASLAWLEQDLIAKPPQRATQVTFAAVPARSGVYVYTKGSAVIYAGSTIRNLRARCKNFLKKILLLPAMQDVDYRGLPCSGPAAVALERVVIDLTRPDDQCKGLGNNALGKNRLSQKAAAYLRIAV